jgi:hypothetical protein
MLVERPRGVKSPMLTNTIYQAYGYAFADAAERSDNVILGVGQRGLRGTEQEGAGLTNAQQALREYARFQGGQVGRDVREFGHEARLERSRKKAKSRKEGHRERKQMLSV